MTIDLQKQLQERFASLPPVIQRTIESTEVESHLRALSSTHKLHVDQWELLENEVIMTLLGFQQTSALAANIEKSVHVDRATAEQLAADISKIVFEPIRQELERKLGHPSAVVKTETDVDKMRTEMLAQSGGQKATPTPVPIPATPPAPTPTAKVERPAAPSAYTGGTASHERKGVEGDPYREPIA